MPYYFTADAGGEFGFTVEVINEVFIGLEDGEAGVTFKEPVIINSAAAWRQEAKLRSLMFVCTAVGVQQFQLGFDLLGGEATEQATVASMDPCSSPPRSPTGTTENIRWVVPPGRLHANSYSQDERRDDHHLGVDGNPGTTSRYRTKSTQLWEDLTPRSCSSDLSFLLFVREIPACSSRPATMMPRLSRHRSGPISACRLQCKFRPTSSLSMTSTSSQKMPKPMQKEPRKGLKPGLKRGLKPRLRLKGYWCSKLLKLMIGSFSVRL